MTARAAWITDTGFALLCECGTQIHVIVEIRGPLPEVLTDIAVTCDPTDGGCGETHWITPVRIPDPEDLDR